MVRKVTPAAARAGQILVKIASPRLFHILFFSRGQFRFLPHKTHYDKVFEVFEKSNPQLLSILRPRLVFYLETRGANRLMIT
jgi:hypothetical protein